MSKNRFFNHKSPRNSAKLVRKFSNIRLIWASIQAKNTKKAKKVEIFLDKKNSHGQSIDARAFYMVPFNWKFSREFFRSVWGLRGLI